MKSALTKAFGSWGKSKSAASELKPAPRVAGRRVLLVDSPGSVQTYFWLGNVGVDKRYSGRPALDLVNTLYGGRFTSILNTELRIKSGLSYSASSGFVRGSVPGEFAIRSFTQTDNTVKALDLTLETLDKLKHDQIEPPMLESARAYVLGQYPLRLETAAHWAAALADLEFFGLGKDYIEGYGPALGQGGPCRNGRGDRGRLPAPHGSVDGAHRRRVEDPRDGRQVRPGHGDEALATRFHAGNQRTLHVAPRFIARRRFSTHSSPTSGLRWRNSPPRSTRIRAACWPSPSIRSPTAATRCCCTWVCASRSGRRRRNIRSGYGKITYFWSFIVALMLFSSAACSRSTKAGTSCTSPSRTDKAWVALLVLGVSVVLETSLDCSAACARSASCAAAARCGYWVKNTRNAELVVVLGEDLAALLGLMLAFIFVALAAATGNPIFDAIGSIVIGVVLIIVSIFIAVRIKGLIVGRSAEDDLQEALESASKPPSAASRNCSTQSRCSSGPQVMLAAKVRMTPGIVHRRRPSSCLNGLERNIKAKFPKSPGASWNPITPIDYWPKLPPCAASHSISAGVLSRSSTRLRYGNRPNFAMMSRCWRANLRQYSQ